MLALVLAGGYGSVQSGILGTMRSVRQAIALDLIECLVEAKGCVPVLLSDEETLLQEAQAIGCRTRRTGAPFDWLREVQQAVREECGTEESVLVLGGCAAPFLTRVQAEELAQRAAIGVAWQNNRLSPDMVLFATAEAAMRVTACATDNEFGYALEQQAGLEVRLLPRELAYAFDVDTPMDALLAALHPEAGARLREAVRAFAHRVPLVQALSVLQRSDYPDVALIGRVHPVEAEEFGQAAGIRLRLYSEERGMKALGRMERGEVRSLVAELAGAIGWPAFFAKLAEGAQAVFFDARVVWAHEGRLLSEQDRFAADLGLYEEIADAGVRGMVKAAVEAPVPVLIGGHSMVSGGLRLLLKASLKEV